MHCRLPGQPALFIGRRSVQGALARADARPVWSGVVQPMGRLAQLVERLVYIENVGGSSPSSPTTLRLRLRGTGHVGSLTREGV